MTTGQRDDIKLKNNHALPTTNEHPMQSGAHHLLDKIAPWATTVGRIILGLVFVWFGYHEVVVPGLWTGYVPFLSPTSHISEVLVLIHGIFLSTLAVGLIVGVLPRTLAGIASLAMLEIIITLTLTAGLSDLVLRDVGVMGLAISVLSSHHERLVLLD